VQPHYQVGFGGYGAANEDVGIREAGGAQSFGDGLGDGRGGAGGEARFDFDHLLVDVAGELLVGFGRHGGRAEAGQRGEAEQDRAKHAAYYDMAGWQAKAGSLVIVRRWRTIS